MKRITFVAALVAVVSSALLGAGCTRPNDTRRVLEQSGYTQIEITGWRPFAADEKDTFSTGFSATAPNGQRVTGAVCSGWFKGNTVRLD
jgi:hypothetical protein